MTNGFDPNWASPPGVTISHLMKRSGMSLYELARKLDLTTNETTKVLSGVTDLTADIADRLAENFGGSRGFWLTRSSQFKDCVKNVPIERRYQTSWLERMPYSELVRLGWIKPSRVRNQRAAELLDFFGLTVSSQWELKFPDVTTGRAFRTSFSFDNHHEAVAAWLWAGEKVASKISCKPWNPDLLRAHLVEVRALTRAKRPQEFVPKLTRIFADCGVALVVARTPRGCHASGATQFITKNKAMMLLSFRFKSNDQFWFSLFHELGHLLLHDIDEVFIDEETGIDVDSLEEKEANEFAAETLIPRRMREEMLNLPRRSNDVIRFAVRCGVAPGIVVGQLQKAGLLGYKNLQFLKRRFRENDIAEVVSL